MELLALVAVTVMIGLLVKFVAFQGAEDVPCFLILLSGIAGTSFVWWMVIHFGGEGTGLGDWRHWAVSLLAGALLELNVGSTGARI